MINAEAHLPVDTSVIMPAAVRAAGAAADALMQASLAPPAGGPPPAAHDFQPALAAPVAQQPLPPPTGGPPPPAGFSQHAPLPQQVTSRPAAPPLPNGEPAPAAPGSQDALWERRARSYHGQMTADRAAAQREIAGLRGQLESVMAQIANGSPAAAPGQPSPTMAMIALDPAMRAKFVEKWGEEMIADWEALAGNMAGSAMGQVANRVGTELQGTRDELHARDNAVMQASLDQMLPDWRVTNDAEDFKNWLQTQDGFSRLTKHQVLLTAWAENDTQAVYRIFAAYMLPQDASGHGMTPPAQPQPSNRLPMHQFAAPGAARPSGHGAPVAAEVNQYTPSQIAQFFSQKGRGIFNDTPARQQWAAAIEADIFAAQREGRVVQG